MRKGAWKKYNWDTWTLWKKVRHVLAVIAAVTSSILMFLIAAYVVLIIFGIKGFISQFIESVLLGIAHFMFG